MNHEKIYTERVEIKLSKDQKKRLGDLADNIELTVSQLLRNIIDNTLNPRQYKLK